MNKENSINTLDFIQLVKSAIEYFGTTKVEGVEKQKTSNNIDEFSQMMNNISSIDFDSLGIEIPEEIDKEIRKAFISQIRYYNTKAQENMKK